MKTIQAIVIDGFHKGHSMRIEYYPTLKLLKPKIIRVDYCCDGEARPETETDFIEYKECFRAVDQKVVLYSTKGESIDVLGFFPHEVTSKRWTEDTTLYFGYHNEPIKRKDEEVVERKQNI